MADGASSAERMLAVLVRFAIEPRFLSEESLKRAVKTNGWVFGIDLSFPNPAQVNNGEPVWLVSMAKQHIILVAAICERLDGPPKKQVPRRNLPLELGVQAASFVFSWIIPTRW